MFSYAQLSCVFSSESKNKFHYSYSNMLIGKMTMLDERFLSVEELQERQHELDQTIQKIE